MQIMSYLENRARLWRVRYVVIVLALLGGGMILSACGSRGSQPPDAGADLEATVAAIVDAKLTETASSSADAEEQTQPGTPEPSEPEGDASVSGFPALITPTPDRSAETMAFIIANTRHFKGDPNAPVTIVEFGDFQ